MPRQPIKNQHAGVSYPLSELISPHESLSDKVPDLPTMYKPVELSPMAADSRSQPTRTTSYASLLSGTYNVSVEPPLNDHNTNRADFEANMDHDGTKPRDRSCRSLPRLWSWELASTISAFALLAATIGVLARFHGQTLPEWPLSINLNSLISILADVLRAAILLIVAEIISQSKWLWFASEPRPLSHLQTFEEASRSVLGSVSLLFTAHTSLVTIAAALVTILTLGIGPFVQQALQTVECMQQMPNINASIPVARSAPPHWSEFYRIAAATYQLTPPLNGVIINGLTNPQGNDTNIEGICPTGNCTFPILDAVRNSTHTSIGMCSSCIDTSSFIKRSQPKYYAWTDNFTLPDGGSVLNVSDTDHLLIRREYDLSSWASSAFTDSFKASMDAHIHAFTVFATTNATCAAGSSLDTTCRPNTFDPDGEDEQGAVAVSCALFPCMQEYRAAITNSKLKETVLSSEPALINRLAADMPLEGDFFPQFGAGVSYDALQIPCIYNGTSYDMKNLTLLNSTYEKLVPFAQDGKNYTVPQECLYSFGYDYGSAISRALDGILDGSCVMSTRQGSNLWCRNENADAWWLVPFYEEGEATLGSIERVVAGLATAMTNYFRKTVHPEEERPEERQVFGTVMQSTLCARFVWEWLMLPLGLTLIATALLITMIVKMYSHPEYPVWKNSLLPLMFWGFRGERIGSDEARSRKELEEQAKNTQAIFHTGSRLGWETQYPEGRLEGPRKTWD